VQAAGRRTLHPEIGSFRLHLAAEGKAAKTIQTYTEAVQWFAATCLPGLADWEQVSSQDVQRWMAWLLDRYSAASHLKNCCRARYWLLA
jgi:integrase/recombinase XerD